MMLNSVQLNGVQGTALIASLPPSLSLLQAASKIPMGQCHMCLGMVLKGCHMDLLILPGRLCAQIQGLTAEMGIQSTDPSQVDVLTGLEGTGHLPPGHLVIFLYKIRQSGPFHPPCSMSCDSICNDPWQGPGPAG